MILKPGILRVHKDVGETSFQKVRPYLDARVTGPKRIPVCHGGTLDPFAEGLLLILLGPATRLFEYLHAVPKTYEAEVVWGRETDTGDELGKTVHTGDASALTPQILERALQDFLGWREQVPPATSAKKIGGEPAYKKAHRGEVVELPPSQVFLHEARWLSHALPHCSRLKLVCRGGYYVRSLARDLGQALGAGAHLARLSRTVIGPWADVSADLEKWSGGPDLLPWLRSAPLTDQDVGALRQGKPLKDLKTYPATWLLPSGFPSPEPLVQAVHQGRLVALLGASNNEFLVRVPLGAGI